MKNGNGNGEPEIKVEPLEPAAARQEIRAELLEWLHSRGFAPAPDGLVYSRVTEVEGKPVKLVVDFKRTAKGARYGYRLNVEKDPPAWEHSPSLSDHQILLEYKAFRDKLFEEKPAPQPAPQVQPYVVQSGQGTQQLLLPPDVQLALKFERMDEEQIIAEMKKEIKERVLHEYFYSFEHQGRKVIGLSYVGIKSAIRKLGHIHIEDLKLEEKEYGWLAICKARDLARDLDAVGVAYQPKWFFPSKQVNPFAATIAASKAVRNAYRHFIPEKVIAETYRAWLEEKEKARGEQNGGD